MPFRVREILLVSSAYDGFVLEEDGSLSQRLYSEYSELSLSSAPRLTHASSVERAIALLQRRRFDLVLTVVRLADGDAAALSRRVKTMRSDLPVALLIFDESDLIHFPEGRPPASIDHVFQWSGDASVLIAAIKLVEDERNVAHDTAAASVRVIVVVEDRVRTYSRFLSLLYPEMVGQALLLFQEGRNDFQRMLRLRARPKVLLATSYEQALRRFLRYQRHAFALISDVSIPYQGHVARDGGIRLAEAVLTHCPGLPVLLQSTDPDQRGGALKKRSSFVRKQAHDFRAQVRLFLREALGFGDFVFRLPDRTEVARAADMYELEQKLQIVPAASVAYHAARNHFSTWMWARTMFDLADRIGPRKLEDFESTEALRDDLLQTLCEARLREQEGVITDLATPYAGPADRFVRAGRGSIGGKGRGVAFVSAQIVHHQLLRRFKGMQIRIPKTVVLGTESFDDVMAQVDVDELVALSDDQVTERVLQADLGDAATSELRRAFATLKGPIAVRSSSLLEDSRFQPFAGVYATYMLPNNHPDPQRRFDELLKAIKAVYASAYWEASLRYLAGTPHQPEEQKMAVIIQQVVGRAYGHRYYPTISGVAQSHNPYAIGGQRAQDGVAHVALGLGHTVVAGGVALRFSPGAPAQLPQFAGARTMVDNTQRRFLAIDLRDGDFDPTATRRRGLLACDVASAEADGSLDLIASVYSAHDDVMRDHLAIAGPRVITFNNVLKWQALPLAEALCEVLQVMRDGVGEDVELEFAVDVPSAEQRAAGRDARLFLLQLRPTSGIQPRLRHNLDRLDGKPGQPPLIARSQMALGNGVYDDIRDVISVQRDSLDAASSRALVDELAQLDALLREQGRGYLLVGPGRWGSSDPTLGIGVRWTDIAGVRLLVELPLGARRIEPSHGTHFFRNLTAARVGYMAIDQRGGNVFDKHWLCRGEPIGDLGLRYLRLDQPLGAYIDGRRGLGVVLERPLRDSVLPPSEAPPRFG